MSEIALLGVNKILNGLNGLGAPRWIFNRVVAAYTSRADYKNVVLWNVIIRSRYSVQYSTMCVLLPGYKVCCLHVNCFAMLLKTKIIPKIHYTKSVTLAYPGLIYLLVLLFHSGFVGERLLFL